MIGIRVRACIKCRQYVIIRPSDPQNQVLIKTFESNHRGHTVITVDLDEVKGQYEHFKPGGSKTEEAKEKTEETAEEVSETPD